MGIQTVKLVLYKHQCLTEDVWRPALETVLAIRVLCLNKTKRAYPLLAIVFQVFFSSPQIAKLLSELPHETFVISEVMLKCASK